MKQELQPVYTELRSQQPVKVEQTATFLACLYSLLSLLFWRQHCRPLLPPAAAADVDCFDPILNMNDCSCSTEHPNLLSCSSLWAPTTVFAPAVDYHGHC